MNRDKSPLEVGLVDPIPLGDRCIVGSLGSLNMEVLAAVSELDEPVFATSRLEGNLEVSLVSVGVFVPGGDLAAVVVVSSILVDDELGVSLRDDEEFARGLRSGFNVPLKVWLIDPGPSANLGAIRSDSAEEVEEGAKLALNSDLDAREVGRVVSVRIGTESGQESPFEVGLVNGIPLGDGGIVASLGTLDVYGLAAVNELDEPPSVTRGFETNLQVSLVSVGTLVPGGDSISVVGGSTLLVNDEISVNSGRDVENVVSARDALDVPLKVILIDPVPGGDALAIFGLGLP